MPITIFLQIIIQYGIVFAVCYRYCTGANFGSCVLSECDILWKCRKIYVPKVFGIVSEPSKKWVSCIHGQNYKKRGRLGAWDKMV